MVGVYDVDVRWTQLRHRHVIRKELSRFSDAELVVFVDILDPRCERNNSDAWKPLPHVLFRYALVNTAIYRDRCCTYKWTLDFSLSFKYHCPYFV